ncbi:MAG: SDR family NAD(P)-dependent oxidoreductase [Mesorhizobium sp.]|nr:SDR family NAD(P)-dependent oxidoreductase [Mesorhizobium sp.]
MGQAVAERFGREGFKVALLARNAERLETMAQGLANKGIEAKGFVADMLDRPGLVSALKAAAAELGPIDVLVYSPSGSADGLITPRQLTAEIEQRSLDVAVLGAIAAVNTLLPTMPKGGALLFTTAVTAQYPLAFTANFGVAAGAALNYAHVLNQDLKADGIHAGIVSIAGIVDMGQEFPDSMQAMPKLLASDVAEAHWQHYKNPTVAETIVGPGDMFKAMAGL